MCQCTTASRGRGGVSLSKKTKATTGQRQATGTASASISETMAAEGLMRADDSCSTGSTHVASVLSKRLRNARKRLSKIQEIRQKKDMGIQLNEDQEMALDHLMAQEILVEELEKMSLLLEEAVSKDIDEAACVGKQKGMDEMKKIAHQETKNEVKKAVKAAVTKEKKMRAEDVAKKAKEMDAKIEEEKKAAMVMGVEKVVELLYFARLFDPFVPYQMDKNAVLGFIASKDDAYGVDQPQLGEVLDMIGVLGKMISTRPLGEPKTHEESLKQCQEVALKYATGDKNSIIGWNGSMTNGQVESTLKLVKDLEPFFKVPVPPQMLPPPPALPTEEYYPMNQNMPAAPIDYLSPEAAAASGQNVLSQFFGTQATVPPSFDPPAYFTQYDANTLGMKDTTPIEEDGMTNDRREEPVHEEDAEIIELDGMSPGFEQSDKAKQRISNRQRSGDINPGFKNRRRGYGAKKGQGPKDPNSFQVAQDSRINKGNESRGNPHHGHKNRRNAHKTAE